jgi:hypothetical protein
MHVRSHHSHACYRRNCGARKARSDYGLRLCLVSNSPCPCTRRASPVVVRSTIVYNPIACWTWNPTGWSFALGGLDFAGGTPVHISSGTAALAISLYLGKRRGYGTDRLAYKPHNTTYVVLGTVFLWFGWFGFNGGSALGANLRAVQACIVTNLAASVGGLTWMLMDYRLERKWSVVGFCSGAVAGLVAITPASGFVGSRTCGLRLIVFSFSDIIFLASRCCRVRCHWWCRLQLGHAAEVSS